MHQEQANLFKVLSERLRHYLDQGEVERAQKIAQTAVEAARRSLSVHEENIPQFVDALRQLASLQLLAKDWAGAELAYKDAFDLARGNRHVSPRQIALLKCELATALDHQEKADLAIPLYQDAIEILESPSVGDPMLAAHIRNNLGLMFKILGRLEMAEDHYLKALEVFEENGAGNADELASLFNNIGGLYQAASHYERALAMHQRALDIWRETAGPRGLETGRSLSNIAAAHHELQQFAEAEQHYAEARSILAEHLGTDPAPYQIASENYAELLRAHQQEQKAKRVAEESAKVLAASGVLIAV